MDAAIATCSFSLSRNALPLAAPSFLKTFASDRSTIIGLFELIIADSKYILVTNSSAYFYFGSKSQGFHHGWEKPSKEHFVKSSLDGGAVKT